MINGPTPHEIHEMDQCMESLKEHTLPQVFSYYNGAIAAGFDKEQAFTIARDFHKMILTGKKDDLDPREN